MSILFPQRRQVSSFHSTREIRNHFIASLLARVASAKRDREIRAEIDALFTDSEVCAEQRKTAEAFPSDSPWQREK